MCVRITLGYSHSKKSCASRRELIRNSLHLLQHNDQSTTEQIVADAIKELPTESSGIIRLKTGGRPTKICLKTAQERVRKILTADDAINMKLQANLSDRQLLTILKSLRSALGRQFVASRISRILNLLKKPA